MALLTAQMLKTRCKRGDGSYAILDGATATTGAPITSAAGTVPPTNEAYFRLFGHRFANIMLKTSAGTATVKLFYANEPADGESWSWYQDEDPGSFALAAVNREMRTEPRGYDWAYLQIAAIAGGATVTATAHVATEE